MFEFKGKKVLVTGASRGIGKAIAQGFAMNGAQVSLVYRKEKELADKLRIHYQAKIIFVSGLMYLLVKGTICCIKNTRCIWISGHRYK